MPIVEYSKESSFAQPSKRATLTSSTHAALASSDTAGYMASKCCMDPDAVAQFHQQHSDELHWIALTRRVTNYLSCAQLYLRDNFFLDRELHREDIKERLLGHWGTCPGLNLVYNHCNYLIKRRDANMFLVVGPGHGAPAILANLYLEGTLGKFYPEYDFSYKGIEHLIKGFSWPFGFPSHVNSEFPGAIHEGGELGYALSVSFGAVFDNPDLIVTCVVGDGECETGPTATAWHSHKFLNPAESGAVLPIVHLNGAKISSTTVYGCMSDQELIDLFHGYGYDVCIVSDLDRIDAELALAMDWAYSKIRAIQRKAREAPSVDDYTETSKWPMVILKTPKGWSGIAELKGKPVEGTFRSHGIPIQHPRDDDESFTKLKHWLESYRIHELLEERVSNSDSPSSSSFRFLKGILTTYAPAGKRMGEHPLTLPTPTLELALPDLSRFEVPHTKLPVSECFCDGKEPTPELESMAKASITQVAGRVLSDIIKLNPKTFRIFSPDELESNKLSDVLKVTNRGFRRHSESYIFDPDLQANPPLASQRDKSKVGSRVLEMLSEHNCQGWMQGYCLTGRFSLFPSYETFLGIITTMMIQYGKFKKLAQETEWRKPTPSLNYIETSTLWRQEHNGYSHQDPMFINNLLNLKSNMARVYCPPDANTFMVALAHCLASKDRVNLLVGSKQELPVFLSLSEAQEHFMAGCSVWKWMCHNDDGNPDIVIAGCGNETNIEAMAACYLLRKDVPGLCIRFVNVMDVLVMEYNPENEHPPVYWRSKRRPTNTHCMSDASFKAVFTHDKPVVFNFHGYPSVIRDQLFARPNPHRFEIHGYMEEGTTTTPFKMLTANRASRYDIAIAALQAAAKHGSGLRNPEIAVDFHRVISSYRRILALHDKYIEKWGKDPAFVAGVVPMEEDFS